MAWTDTYKSIVYNIESTFTDRASADYHIKQAMLILVDLNASSENGIEAATQLLPKIKKLHNWVLHYWDINETRKLTIYYINEFTERHNGDLTTFINSISWTDGCVPYNWAETSEQSRFDTSEWIVCS